MDPARARRRNHIAILLSLTVMFASLAFPSAAYADLYTVCYPDTCGSCGFINCVDDCTDGSAEQGQCNSFCPPCTPGIVFCENYPGCFSEGYSYAMTCACH